MIKHERRLILRYPGDKNTWLKISLRCVFMGFRVNTWWREYHYCSFCWRFRMSILILCITDIIVVVIFWEGTVRRSFVGVDSGDRIILFATLSCTRPSAYFHFTKYYQSIRAVVLSVVILLLCRTRLQYFKNLVLCLIESNRELL